MPFRTLPASSVALGLGLAGIGVGTAAATATTDVVADDGPTVVEHAFGTTVVEDVPQRIVALATQWSGVLLEMDAPFVGYADDGMATDGLYPWEADAMPADARAIPVVDGIPYEQVAALEPDLIVVTFLVNDQAGFDALDLIAPTIPLLTGPTVVDPWQDLTRLAGELLGDPARAAAIITGCEEQVAAFPDVSGKTYAFANYVPGDAIYIVADADDGATRLFTDLGLEIAPAIVEAAGDVAGRATVSLEQADLLEADIVLILANGGDVHDLIGFDQLTAVQTGAWAEVTYELAVALNTPSALSLNWALGQIHPVLEAASSA